MAENGTIDIPLSIILKAEYQHNSNHMDLYNSIHNRGYVADGNPIVATRDSITGVLRIIKGNRRLSAICEYVDALGFRVAPMMDPEIRKAFPNGTVPVRMC